MLALAPGLMLRLLRLAAGLMLVLLLLPILIEIEGLIASLDYKPDVIGITETWEQPNSFGQYKCLPGYIFVSNGNWSPGRMGIWGI